MLSWIVDMNQALLWFPADWRTLMIGRPCISIICCTVHSLEVNFLSKVSSAYRIMLILEAVD